MQKEILLNIKGMNCAACSASVEGALSKVDGVVYAGVNLAAPLLLRKTKYQSKRWLKQSKK